MRPTTRLFLLTLVVAAFFRFHGLDWDGGHSVHPDERRIVFALGDLSFHPLQLNPHFFAYGSFPIYLQKAWGAVAGIVYSHWDTYEGRFFTSRVLSAWVGVATVAWTYWVGLRLYTPTCALWAALFLALAVLPIQNAHFLTFDSYQSLLILMALERLIVFSTAGARRQLLTAAAITGLALATKVSSAPLLLAVLVAALWAPVPLGAEARSRSERVIRLIAVLFVILAAFAIGEPYAFLDPTAALHDIREQSSMVRHPGELPYTIQYLGTRPLLDDLRQAFTWGMGPALGLAAGAGMVAALVRGLRGRKRGEVLVLCFFLPYLLVTAWFPVKFMRYLLPLYPLWCLYAARWLAGGGSERPRGLRRAALAAVALPTAAYALAFASIYSRPHVWVTASEWIYREVPPGSTLLLPHWEESLPLGLPGRSGDQYRRVELPLYESDDEGKIANLAASLSNGDFLVFPSKRHYGSIPKAPQRFPVTNRFLQMLFAGDLGYRLEKDFTSRPSLFGYELADESSDESFTVYDHPKTLVFRRTLAYSADQLAARIRNGVPSSPVSPQGMLEATADDPPSERGGAEPLIVRSWPAALSWTFVLTVLLFVGRRLLARMIPRLSEPALTAFGCVFGYLLFSYLCWIATAVGVTEFSPATTALVAVALAFAASRCPPAGSPDRAALAVFYGTFVVFLAIRAGNPEIYWGEKPMDFSFLNALYRTASLPPPEPWMAGEPINYPYFGHFAVAALGKLAHVSPALAFNLGIATIAALTAAASFGVGALLGGRRGAAIAVLLVTFAGNLSGIHELVARRAIGFDYFWATSRVVKDTINEFPLWSFLFADLHAHVLVLPLSVMLLGLAFSWASAPAGNIMERLAVSLVLGAAAATNSWSFPLDAGVLLIAAIFCAPRMRLARVLEALMLIGFSFFWFAPFWLGFRPPPRNWGFETARAPITGVLEIFGLSFFVLLGAIGSSTRLSLLGRGVRVTLVAVVACTAWFSTRGAFALVSLAALAAAVAEEAPAARFALAIAGVAAFLGCLADSIFLWDRMNTVFKYYFQMWVLFAVASSYWLASRGDKPSSVALPRRAWATVFGLLVAASAVTAFTDVLAVLRTKRVDGPRPTLDGQAYLDVHNGFEARGIRWLNRHVSSLPVTLEAEGDSYQEFGRISMNTGLPTVLGWKYHLSQRAHPWPEIDQRERDVQTIYQSLDRAKVEELLERYPIAMVVVGALETRHYGESGLSKFKKWDDLFRPLYRNEGVAIYGVRRRFGMAPALAQPSAPAVAAVVPRPPPLPDQSPQLPPGRLREPRGLASEPSGALWVVDFGNNRIQVFDPDLKLTRAFGGPGNGPGEFRDPCGIAIGPDGNAYVADTWNHRVQVFGPDGKFLRQWSSAFYGPRGIAAGPDGSIYVADTGNGRIVKFSAFGEKLAQWGNPGSGTGQFHEPTGIAVGRDGRVYVADAGNRRVVVLSPSGSAIAEWPVDGWEQEVFREPYLAILPDGRLAATDPNHDRVILFAPDGRRDADLSLEKGAKPVGITVGKGRRAFVTELGSSRVKALPIGGEPSG